jgi:hypothetical protein
MSIKRTLASSAICFSFATFIAGAAYLFGLGSLQDADNALSAERTTPYQLILLAFGGVPLVLVILNTVVYVAVVRFFIKTLPQKIPVLIFMLNPFLLMNVFDAYNKFSFLMLLAFVIVYRYQQHEVRKFDPVASFCWVVGGFTHPIFLLGFFLVCPVWSMLTIAILALFATDVTGIGGQILHVLAPDKSLMFEKFGFDLASGYGGNFLVSHAFLGQNFESVLFRSLSFFFFAPLLQAKFSWSYAFLNVFIVLSFLGLFGRFLGTRYVLRFVVPFLCIIITVSAFVGNVAVMYRHILPLTPILLFFGCRNWKTNKPAAAAGKNRVVLRRSAQGHQTWARDRLAETACIRRVVE